MTRVPLACALLLVGAAGCAANNPAPRTAGPTGNSGGSSGQERIIAPEVPVLPGMPQAVRVGFTIYVAAMVPVDSAGRIVGAGNLASQTKQALSNLVAVVRAARGVPGDVVRLTVYLRNPSPEAVATVRTAVLEGLDRASPPAMTVVGVTALPEPTMEVMIDATAQLRSEFPDRTRMMPGRP